ncbi:chitin synthase, partial [Trichodelitschia bisporula]
MAYNNRLSTFSSMSTSGPRPGNGQSAQVSTQTLLNALHTSYQAARPHTLESSTSLVVNTWLTAATVGPDGRIGGTADLELARRAWEHARRRAEDGCIVLGSLHDSTPCMMAPFVSCLPIQAPNSFYSALEVIRAFTHCVTPSNPSFARYSSLAATFTLNLNGEINGAELALSKSGIDTTQGLLHVPSEPGHRAFDVFYYLSAGSASQAEREFLDLKPFSAYALLRKSGTFSPPGYVPTADDAAAAEDFRTNLRTIGIKGTALRNLISALAGLLKLGETLDYLVDAEILDQVCEDAAVLLDIDQMVLRAKCDTIEREILIGGIYEALVDWVISRANDTMRQEIRASRALTDPDANTPFADEDDGDTVCITVVNIPGQELGKAVALRTVFDDSEGINAEMKEDGVPVVPAGSSILKEMQSAVSACEPDLGIMGGAAGREQEQQRDRREGVLEKVAQECDPDSYLREVLHPVQGEGIMLGSAGRFDLANTLSSSRVWFQLCLHPTDDAPAELSNASNHWSAAAVSRQLRSWRLPEWANRRNRALDFTSDFDFDEFATRYSRLGCKDGRDGVESWVIERGWSNGEVVVGRERVWVREAVWWEAETMLDVAGPIQDLTPDSTVGRGPMDGAYAVQSPGLGSNFFAPQFGDAMSVHGSKDNLLTRHQSMQTLGVKSQLGGHSMAPTAQRTVVSGGDYGLGRKGDAYKGEITYDGDVENGEGRVMIEEKTSKKRKMWVALVWFLTFWIPSPFLRYVGRMKRPDVRMAWREKVVLIFMIFLLNAIVVFYIVEFGLLLCPNLNKAWDAKEVSFHQGSKDYWVSHHGKVYDLTKFYKLQHSDTDITTDATTMMEFAGTNVDELIRPPLTLACPKLVTSDFVILSANNTVTAQTAIHTTGPTFQTNPKTKLHNIRWYTEDFLPKMKTFYKGDLVWDPKTIRDQGENDNRMWFRLGQSVYDLTDYFYTQTQVQKQNPLYKFFPEDVEQLIMSNPGADLQSQWNDKLNATTQDSALQCLDNYFYIGKVDFRLTPKCQVQPYILLAFTIVLCAVILTKFLAALQLGSKRRPAQQDKFVICQVPAYTEGEEQIRKGLDSLTALNYDNKRKLICVICDGMIVGGGNDRPTPKIVLDILGVDPKVDPAALPFKSVGQGAEQLNYGKVYSGLYEYEGNVVPYLVVVKVGKESEQSKSKPGNRGKRDSQILLMSFLNRVHHRSPMSPLELEMFHQINNVIGVDPELYEYLLMVDADTMVREDSLNRLVAACANDSKIAGICGETSLENEEHSWWTMIQVYEYYISHHLAKAFESLFGSVTCLPGCFCMYRLRTEDKHKPLLISDQVIEEYSDGNVDTLHKKNLLSLGEDRYLTTLMTKHFPHMSYKFVPDALAHTAAPETWSVLLSQRRRWINSTIHNLAELVFLKDMCGFCCFSMRFVVFIDLFGTLILPATCAYLAYLLYKVGTHSGQFPMISIILLAAVYGLQAVIFIIKRQWQHIGWMIIYILAYPIYSFVLPLYSFWKQDDFSWGNTRIVIGEKGDKQIVAVADEGFDPRSIPLQRWDDYATLNALPGRRGEPGEKVAGMMGGSYDGGAYEMDEMQSVYSSVKPASTILTGFPGHGPVQNAYNLPRQSTYSALSLNAGHERMMSLGGASHDGLGAGAGYAPNRSPSPGTLGLTPRASQAMLHPNASRLSVMQRGSPRLSRPVSQVNFMEGPRSGPSDAEIITAIRECLKEVDLDTVTKKQLKALAEGRLQTQLVGEKRRVLDEGIDVELANM